jgi:hypothetical protein
MNLERWRWVLVAGFVCGCDRDTGPAVSIAPSFRQDANAESEEGGCALPCGLRWSEPANLGELINSPSGEQSPSLSPDELSLYFTSNRAGGQGGNDIYVARRASLHSPWQAPENLGAVINSPTNDAGGTIIGDGRVMLFSSGRDGGAGLRDIYVSHRADPADDHAWGFPANLGARVNTVFDEGPSDYVERGGKDGGTLYMSRSAVLMAAQYDMFTVELTSAGVPVADAEPIVELNVAAPIHDAGPEVRKAERLMIFQSTREGTLGRIDLWTSTRRSVRDPWSAPENMGTPINTEFAEQQPTLSRDGRTMIFASDRPGGPGGFDLWVSHLEGRGTVDR